MTVEAGNGQIKVILSNADSQSLGINFKNIDCKRPQTKILLKAIFKAAAEKLGQSFSNSRLLIEAYPYVLGGGILYFTPLAKATKKKLTKRKPHYLAFDFYNGSNLLNALELLYKNPKTRNLKSKIFDVCGVFRLVTEANSINNPTFILDYCDAFYNYERVKKYTCEHGCALTSDFAVFEVGHRLVA